MPAARLLALSLVIFLVFPLAGCGKKGPLYLPDKQAPADAATQPPIGPRQ